MLIGPGGFGDYKEHRSRYRSAYPDTDGRFLRPFVEDPKIGQLVVPKRPRRSRCEIIAVGKIMSDYFHPGESPSGMEAYDELSLQGFSTSPADNAEARIHPRC
jgi:hypothetical protein